MTPDTEVFLLDTLGELPPFYAAGDVAFVGGSLVPIGGHNLLEPAALGLPIVAGPHNFNSADIAKLLVERGARAHRARRAGARDAWSAICCRDPARAPRWARAAAKAVDDNRGAVAA